MPEGIPYASSNVIAGTGLELNYIGDHCYAYSGKFSSSTTTQTMINFNTGSGTIIARIQCNGATADINSSTVGNGATTTFTIKVNGIIVARIKTDTSTEDMPTTAENELILPPYTNLTVAAIGTENDDNLTPTINIIGRVYK